MVVHVARHEGVVLSNYNDPDFVDLVSGELAEDFSRLVRNPASLNMVLDNSLEYARIRSALDPCADEIATWEAWVSAMQASHALFASSTKPKGETVECMIDQKMRAIPTTGPKYYTNASNWLKAFYLMLICREQERKQQLCEIPVDLLRSAGESDGAKYNEYIYHWVAALQAYTLRRDGLVEELTSAIKKSHPEQVEFGDAETLNKIVYPPMNLFRLFIQRKIPEFNEALVQALELHKQYFTVSEERTRELEGVVALGVLAIACLAYDAGYWDPEFQIEVESEYIPKALLERSWWGEFPT